MVLIKEKTDLFSLPDHYVLVHCISEDCAMGAGIAVAFEKKFKMRNYLLQTIKENAKTYPCAILFPLAEQKVINMITKQKYWNKPTYDTFEAALDEVVKICEKNQFSFLAMPKIGCGLDRLDWTTVEKMIEEKFKNLDIQIKVCYL